MKQATFDVAAGRVRAPCRGALDFHDGSGADCVNEKPHIGGPEHEGCVWSRAAWDERHGRRPASAQVDHDGHTEYDCCGADCPEAS